MESRARASSLGPALVLGLGLVWSPLEAAPEENEVQELAPVQVVSTATRTERLQTETPIRTELIASSLFEAANTNNLAAALEYFPGVRVEANCQNCGTAEVQIRGLGTGYSQILFDEQPLFSGLAAVYGLEHIPTAFIDQIEVVKGGGSSLYGPGAVAGVVNIIPREPVRSGVDFETTYENFDGASDWSAVGLWDWVSADDQMAGSVFGDYRTNDAIDLNGDGFTEVTEKDFYTLGTNFWVYPGENTKISGNYAYTWEERRGGDSFELLPHETQIAEALEHGWHRGGVFWEQDVSPDLYYQAGASFSHIERDSYYGGVGNVPLPSQTGFDPILYAAAVEDARLLYGFTETTRYYLDSLVTQTLGQHTLSYGVQYKYDEVFDEKRDDRDRSLRTDGTLATTPGEDPIADGSFDNLGFFVQDEWDPNAAVTVIGGLRLDKHSDIEDWIFSPRAAVRYTINSDWTLRASFSTGFRAPEIFDEDFHIEILDDPTRTFNDPGLKEERSSSYAGGFVWTPSFADNRLQVDAEVFDTRLQDSFFVSDQVFTDPSGNAFKLRTNTSGATIHGAEANALFRFSPETSLEVGATYLDARYDEAQEVLPGIFEDEFLETPRWSGVARLNTTFARHYRAFLAVNYTGPMKVLNEEDGFLNQSTDSFFVVDLSVTREFELGRDGGLPRIDVTLGVRNLFDERQDDLTSGPNRDAGYFYGPRFPRSFFISGHYHF